jgi:undecaprenyl-diphosphatase
VAVKILLATAITGAVGGAIIKLIEKTAARGSRGVQIEDLFSHLELIAPALAAGGVIILIAGIRTRRNPEFPAAESSELSIRQAGLIGAVQGLCLPFRGFSRSGATISAGMLAGIARPRAEEFSFALAVALTPAVVVREALRVAHAQPAGHSGSLLVAFLPSVLGAVIAFVAGLIALKWLSRWLEGGRWYLFGIYCLAAAAFAAVLHRIGY